MNIVAVTGCSEGIAQSKLASESLKGAVKDTEEEIKVEIHGSAGAENVLEEEDIEASEVAIVASDISVDTERFEGTPLVRTDVQAAVTDPEQLIERAKKAVEKGEEKVEYEPETASRSILKRASNFFN